MSCTCVFPCKVISWSSAVPLFISIFLYQKWSILSCIEFSNTLAKFFNGGLFFFFNQHHFKPSCLKDDIACEHFEFILFSIVIVLIYFSCFTLLAISSKVMVGDISDSCRRKRSIVQIFLGHPQTSGSKSGSSSARCSKNNRGHFYS